MLFGYFDFFVLGTLIIFNIKYLGKVDVKTGCWMGAVSFGFVLPFISMAIELQVVGEWMDSFEVVYTFLRFSAYWIIGVVQCIIIGLTANKKNEYN